MSHKAVDQHIDNLIDAREEGKIKPISEHKVGQCVTVACYETVYNLGGYFCEEHFYKGVEDFRKELYASN